MKVAIVTPTIREGWWNIMAENLSKQTDKEFTWVIIDDHKEDRAAIAEKYASKFALNVQYTRSKPQSPKRAYGLCNANNTLIEVNESDMFIWLQDFMLIPPNTVERIKRLGEIYPLHLISCVDDYFESKKPFNLSNKEDYFDGDVDVLGEHMIWPFTKKPYECWRKKDFGCRVSDDPYEFEMNFCAIPRAIIISLNGWWEFMDAGFGFDNTEFAYRALQRFQMIVVQDLVGTGINHTPLEKGEDIKNRYYNFNDPRYNFLASLTEVKQLPIIRDVNIDKQIKTPYQVPFFLNREFAEHYMRLTTKFFVPYWISLNFPDFYKTLEQKDIG